MRRTALQRLKALELEDLKVQAREDRKRRIREGWKRLVTWEKGLKSWMRDMGRLATAAGVLYGTMQRPVRWVVKLYKAREVGRAELPSTGVPSTAIDFVTKDHPRRN